MCVCVCVAGKRLGRVHAGMLQAARSILQEVRHLLCDALARPPSLSGIREGDLHLFNLRTSSVNGADVLKLVGSEMKRWRGARVVGRDKTLSAEPPVSVDELRVDALSVCYWHSPRVSGESPPPPPPPELPFLKNSLSFSHAHPFFRISLVALLR